MENIPSVWQPAVAVGKSLFIRDREDVVDAMSRLLKGSIECLKGSGYTLEFNLDTHETAITKGKCQEASTMRDRAVVFVDSRKEWTGEDYGLQPLYNLYLIARNVVLGFIKENITSDVVSKIEKVESDADKKVTCFIEKYKDVIKARSDIYLRTVFQTANARDRLEKLGYRLETTSVDTAIFRGGVKVVTSTITHLTDTRQRLLGDLVNDKHLCKVGLEIYTVRDALERLAEKEPAIREYLQEDAESIRLMEDFFKLAADLIFQTEK